MTKQQLNAIVMSNLLSGVVFMKEVVSKDELREVTLNAMKLSKIIIDYANNKEDSIPSEMD